MLTHASSLRTRSRVLRD